MASMKGKTVLVTGATSGIGEATAIEIARQGAQVIIVGRNPQKSAVTAHHILMESCNTNIDYLLADLTSMASIRRLALQFKGKYDRLDVLINNAGGFFWRRELTQEGFEKTFALNHLNYFLLTLSLLDKLKASAPARVVNVASDNHHGARLDFDNLQGEKHYSGIKAYGSSKLANVFFTYELARRLEGSGVTVNALHPGFVATNIWSSIPKSMRWMVGPVIQRIALSPEKGAETCIYLATSPEVEGVTGQYFTLKRAVRTDPTSYDEQTARLLWDRSLEMVGGPI